VEDERRDEGHTNVVEKHEAQEERSDLGGIQNRGLIPPKQKASRCPAATQ